MAARCLYCGQSSRWRSLKRLLDDQFCNITHREAYNERLQKIVTQLGKYQNHPPKGIGADLDPAMAHLAMPLGRDPRMGGPVPIVPSTASPASSHPLMLSVMCLPEIAVAQTDHGFVSMARALIITLSDPAPLIFPKDAAGVPTIAPALAPYQPQTFPTLLSGDCTPSFGTEPPALNPVRPARAEPRPRSYTLPLPMAVENVAHIERWKLRIRFQRFDHSSVSAYRSHRA